MPGFPEAQVSYKELLVYEEMNEAQILIPELRQKFSVRELLDGVEELSTRIERRMDESGRLSSRWSAEVQATPQPRILRIVVASAGDVQPERDVLPSVIEEAIAASLPTVDCTLCYRGGKPIRTLAFILKGRKG